jgi:hypothetical protein
VAGFSHNKVVADVEPSIGIHVEVLVGSDYGSARCLGRAECLSSSVVNCGDGRRRTNSGGCASRWSCTPPCSVHNRWTLRC